MRRIHDFRPPSMTNVYSPNKIAASPAVSEQTRALDTQLLPV
jgi:hypothetical protein